MLYNICKRGSWAGLVVFALCPQIHAQDSLLAGADTSVASSEVAAEGFQATATAEGDRDATEAQVSAGGLFATGNSRSLAITGAAKMRLRRQQNQYTGALGANYARSSVSTDEPMEATVENYQANIRYDRFLSERWALFVSDSFRRDRFQGLSVRTNFDPGVALYALTQPAQRLWFEAGYDMQYDVRTGEAIEEALLAETPVTKTEMRHAVRLFGGYNNTINEHVAFNTGLEYLQAFADGKNWRLNWELGLTSTLSDKFSLNTTFNLRYDNNPLPSFEKLDTVTAFSVVYSLK